MEKVPVHTQAFDVDPVFSCKIFQSFGSEIQWMEEVVEDFLFQGIEWNRVTWISADFFVLSILKDFLK
jgi:hypothetical protein